MQTYSAIIAIQYFQILHFLFFWLRAQFEEYKASLKLPLRGCLLFANKPRNQICFIFHHYLPKSLALPSLECRFFAAGKHKLGELLPPTGLGCMQIVTASIAVLFSALRLEVFILSFLERSVD